MALPAVVLSIILLLSAGGAGAGEVGRAVEYVGSTACAVCHEGKYNMWEETLHANVIKDARRHPEAVLGDFEIEDVPFKREEILYTVGSHWDQRYMTEIEGKLYVLPKLWSVQSRQWRPYNVWSWRKRPWSHYCAGCHVTGYDTGSGEYAEMRIGCESCHGPGEKHAASSGINDIVNPARLEGEQKDMICAACHVRGTDLSGEYYFPVGYQPGGNLADHYRPIDMEEGETPGDAISRLYDLWAVEREESGRGKCEVCGIYGSSDKIKEDASITRDIMKYCLRCHEFGENLDGHTQHPGSAGLVCLDCHRPKPFSLEEEKVDVHSVRYYRIHQESCYDEDIDKSCIKCHAHEQMDRSWARRRILVDWKKLPELDH